MAEELKVKVTVENRNALRDLKAVDKGAEKTGKAFLGLGKAVGVAAVAFAGLSIAKRVGGFLAESTKLAFIQEDAERKLAVSLGRTSKELVNYSKVLQAKTTFGDEEILNAQALVANFVKEEEQIKKLTPAILDLAIAKGMNLTAAADLVTKSVASSTNAMTRYGVEVVGAAGSTERIDSAVANLGKAFGGLAEGMAQTNQGQMKQLSNDIGDLQERVAGGFMEAITEGIIPFKRSLLSIGNDFVESGALETLGDSVTWIIKQFGKATTAMAHATKGFRIEALDENLASLEVWRKKSVQTYASIQDADAKFRKGFATRSKESNDLMRADLEKRREAWRAQGKSFVARKKELEDEKNSIYGLTQVVDDYVGTTNNSTTGLNSNTDALKANMKEVKSLLMWHSRFMVLPQEGGGTGAGILAQSILGTEEENKRAAEDAKISLENQIQQTKEMAISSAMNIANSIMAIKNAQAQQEIALLDKQMKAEIGSRNMSGRARTAIESKYAKAREKVQKEQAEKNRKLQIAQAFVGLAQGIASTWANSMSLGPIAGPIMAGINTGLLTGVTVAQVAAMKAQAFANGGVVDGFGGASRGVDNRMATVRSGEMVLNADQQKNLFDIANGGNGGGSISVSIENFKGGDSELADLEDMLLSLKSNNRIQDIF